MRNKLEHILLSLLLGLSILLGLSFLLNINFGFNIFFKQHWDKLAQLQANHTPINPWFYAYITIAIFLFLIGLVIIYIPAIKRTKEKPVSKPAVTSDSQQKTTEKVSQNIPEPVMTPLASRPPRLNLPKNIAEIVTKRQNSPQANQPQTTIKSTTQKVVEENPYTPIITQTFKDAGYVVKPNPTISGFTPNLFAIGNNEIVWIGGVDCKIETLQNAVQKLESVFEETLSDIPINVQAFILDNLNTQTSNESILVFQSIDELKKFVSENPADTIEENEQDNFNSYSEYIDTIIQYIKNL